jgi:plasmid stabilization system protein ParE
MRVRFTPRARNDLDAILKYLDERSPQGARNVHRTIRRTIELIGQAPEGGGRVKVQNARVFRPAVTRISSIGALRLAKHGSCIFVTPPGGRGVASSEGAESSARDQRLHSDKHRSDTRNREHDEIPRRDVPNRQVARHVAASPLMPGVNTSIGLKIGLKRARPRPPDSAADACSAADG